MFTKFKRLVLLVVAAEPVAIATALEALVAALAVVFGALDVEQALAIVAALGSIHTLLRSAVFSPRTVGLDYTENVVATVEEDARFGVTPAEGMADGVEPDVIGD